MMAITTNSSIKVNATRTRHVRNGRVSSSRGGAGRRFANDFAAGLAVYLDPLRHKSSGKGSVRVASLEALPSDGIPRKFPVLATRVDAWNKFREVPIGAVYLRRTGDQIEALNVVCPHAGCFV